MKPGDPSSVVLLEKFIEFENLLETCFTFCEKRITILLPIQRNLEIYIDILKYRYKYYLDRE